MEKVTTLLLTTNAMFLMEIVNTYWLRTFVTPLEPFEWLLKTFRVALRGPPAQNPLKYLWGTLPMAYTSYHKSNNASLTTGIIHYYDCSEEPMQTIKDCPNKDPSQGYLVKKGKVCGLCGNYDDNGNNDFSTRSHVTVGTALEFVNSWKGSPNCPDANSIQDACFTNPKRKPAALKGCSIIISDVFAACHSQVDAIPYYDACLSDTCACNAGGDCDCFCTAVAAYAEACSKACICIHWRTPELCPLFCDYYNQKDGGCEWHYKPCGAPCMKTCRNPSGQCLHDIPGLEGQESSIERNEYQPKPDSANGK
ncbi:hypothetical protein NDU88_003772 [Pleurodeles waltl]|uniref:VWFD domain-containing protein n=1 Tax=Pleurodeles waltl TaxID=8319 RepID=A0AAV7TPF1_PLEWA|nr:hypothetical protein NDU88_003772 [Pleurodeles waltl]